MMATMAAGMMQPSQFLRKFVSYRRQHDLAVALREFGRVERTLFIIDWLLDTDMQRRASWRTPSSLQSSDTGHRIGSLQASCGTVQDQLVTIPR